ncbi:MAG: mechanosensitive ion channel [Proteobacteria bacterium]|nr:mechanosensitive ion channel [Pseudomonadota bacterium]
MKSLRSLLALLLVALLVAATYGWWRTSPSVAERHARGAQQGPVDASALETARRLVALAGTGEERELAAAAVATADHLLDLSFADALREAAERPAPATPEVRAAEERLNTLASRLIADTTEIARLQAEQPKTGNASDGGSEAALALAQAQLEVDQYDFNAANDALTAAGGNLRARIEALVAEHHAASPTPAASAAAAPATGPGLVRLVGHWFEIERKDRALAAARGEVEATLADAARARAEIAARVGAGAPANATPSDRLAWTRRIAADQHALSALDERVTTARALAGHYDDWRALTAIQLRAVLHRMLRSLALITAIGLVLLFVGRWLGAGFARLKLDRRQVETLRTVSTVALQVIAVLVVALVIIGPPTQLGVFLGLAGAGLTVALKDFIVAFVGWLVLMGKNGIRIGDWVEINGVAGEVVELGIFHTVLLETGNWTDSGHPTGRRVTFTNSFAIEGHYFNFSTTGQWLWDELQVVVPTGADLYAVVGAISQRVKDATADHAREAEAEWRRAAPSRQLTGLSVSPAINVRPVIGGTEIALRYITRASDRFRLRAALYEAAVELLGQKPATTGA